MNDMEVQAIYEKIDTIATRQQGMELEFGRHQVYVTGMLEKILEQTSKTNGTVAAAVKTIEANKDKQIKDHNEHHEEIHKLNLWKSKLGGVWAAVLVAGTILGGALTLVVTYLAEHK